MFKDTGYTSKARLRIAGLVALLVTVQCFFGIFAATAVLRWHYEGIILNGVRVSGINIGGMSRQEALAALRSGLPYPGRDSRLVILTPEGREWPVAYSALDWCHNYEGAVDEALCLGKTLNNAQQLTYFFHLVFGGAAEIDLPHTFSITHLRTILEKIAPDCNICPQNAQLAFDNARITILPSVQGRELDVKETINRVAALDPREHRIEMAFKSIAPELTSDQLRLVNARIGFFITSFNPANKARTKNVTLASGLLNNAFIPPGGEFSLNERLGPRTPEKGYCKADLLTANGLFSDYGGGVCQVASTLYNAVLGAGLTVTQRKPHSRPVPYIPAGRDATIYQDIIDLRFRNDRPHPVLITSEIHGDKLFVGIFGHEDNAENIIYKTETEKKVLKPKTVFKIDPSLPSGEMRVADPGREGYVITTYEVKSINGRTVHRYPIALHQVNPRTAVIYISKAQHDQHTVDK